MDAQQIIGLVIEYWPISLGFGGIAFWILFILRAFFANGYHPYTEAHWAPTAVVAVNYRESEEVVRKSIESVLNGTKVPSLFVIVFNGKLIGYEQNLAKEYKGRIVFLFRREGDKRRAMAAGARYVIAENLKEDQIKYIVHMDGDTIWQKDTLQQLIKPFADDRIDAVASAQEYLNPDQSVWTTIQALLSHWGHNIGQKWQSAKYCSSCLRGRTNAFRLEIIAQNGFLNEFEEWYFCGNRRKSGDDGTLTFLTLKYNYERRGKIGGTFVQMSSVVKTLAEPGWDKFWKMRVRCMSNTHTRYIEAVFNRWFWAQNWRFKLELVTSVIIPLMFFTCTLTFMGALISGFYLVSNGKFVGLIPPVAMFGWYMVGRFIRAPKWASSKLIRLQRWPIIVLTFLFPLVIARWWAMIVIFLPQKGWGSRTDKTVAVSFENSTTKELR